MYIIKNIFFKVYYSTVKQKKKFWFYPFFFSQVLNSDGFTLDTTDFADLLDDDEEVDYEKSKIISNQEMLKYLNSEIEEGNNENEEEHVVSFVGILFEELKPRMHSIFGNGKVKKFFTWIKIQK